VSRQAQVWASVLGTAAGVAAVAGSGQLGIGYGLGFLRLAREFPTDGVWSSQLTWVAWFAALAVIGGSAAGAWAAQRQELDLQIGNKLAVVAAAAVGAAVVVPLTLLPADSATVLMRDRPVLATALTGLLGVVVGIAAAVATLSVRLVAVSLTLLVAVVWLLALVSALPALLPGAGPPDVRLAVLDLGVTGGGSGSTVAVITIPLVALLVCGAVAAAARWQGLSPLLAAVASTAAPGLLALTYLIGTPGTGDREVQTSPYAASLIAVAVGLVASLLIGTVKLPSRRPAGVGPELPDPGTADTVGFRMDPLALPAPPASRMDASPASRMDASPVSPAGASRISLDDSPVSPAGTQDSTEDSAIALTGRTEPTGDLPDWRSTDWRSEDRRSEDPLSTDRLNLDRKSLDLPSSTWSEPSARPEPTRPESPASSRSKWSELEPPAWPPPASRSSLPDRPGSASEPPTGSTSDRASNLAPDRPLSDQPERPASKPWERPAGLDRPFTSRFDPPTTDKPTTPPERPTRPEPTFTSRFKPLGPAGSGSVGTSTAGSSSLAPGEAPEFKVPKARTPSDPPTTSRFDPPTTAWSDPPTSARFNPPAWAVPEASRPPAVPAGSAPTRPSTEPTPTLPAAAEPVPTEPVPTDPTDPTPTEPGAADELPARGSRWSRLLKPKRDRKPAPEPMAPDPIASLPAPRRAEADILPEPVRAPEPALDQPADRPTSPPPLAPPRPGREGDEEHLDWISSLASDDDGEELEETGRSRRRLRRDRDLSISVDDLPEPPSRPVHRS